ncbi:adenine deaminase [Arcicella sp. DC2W]|uniref:Adenine deaminase n=1 Tax=Arcicella gelida TaxID=2984195 RepID=A0ABU5S3X0_9BACT|nr:adenine deaminase [Arcicella sp. DC2W]MEA5403163.1 adenine deaminase [Arcicella sp. DC2W]
MQVTGNIINIFEKTIKYGILEIQDGKIVFIKILAEEAASNTPYILPGFVDAHVHVESSMLTPAQFARLAVVHGTVSTVSDPHEIGNVLGKAGVEYMIHNARQTPFKFCFGAPSCVPATTFETAGAIITPKDIEELFQQYDEIGYLAEVMNFPGVLNGDGDMLAKIALAKSYNKPVDGHAPGLRGDAARKYIEAGCQTDHECFTEEEALDKLKYGMKILIREGSAAKNFEALIGLLPEYYNELMFCSDDKHPDNLVEGHINLLVKRALAKYPSHLFEILKVACVNPVLHYRLPVGLLREGDSADFILIENIQNFEALQTYISGEMVAEKGISKIPNLASEIVNHFECSFKTVEQFQVKAEGERIQVIEVLDGQLITLKLECPALIEEGLVVSDLTNDILKIAVVNRYHDAPPAIGFIKNFGLKQGAIGSSVAHDSHNIIVVGVDDESITEVVNMIIKARGGVATISEKGVKNLLELPIAGIMSGEDGYSVAKEYSAIDRFAKDLGCTLNSPFMSLSFMALLVIPNLKLSDFGLFDGEKFSFTSLFVEKIN